MIHGSHETRWNVPIKAQVTFGGMAGWCVCVCVRDRKRAREREKENERTRERENDREYIYMCVCVCVRVCVMAIVRERVLPHNLALSLTLAYTLSHSIILQKYEREYDEYDQFLIHDLLFRPPFLTPFQSCFAPNHTSANGKLVVAAKAAAADYSCSSGW